MAATLMIVDDSQEIRELVSVYARRAGEFEVVGEASDGADALRVAEAVRPAAVVLDLRMPVMDGLQALPGLRERLPDACIVMWSSQDAEAVRDQALAGGADDYLPKSEPIEAVLAALKTCINRTG